MGTELVILKINSFVICCRPRKLIVCMLQSVYTNLQIGKSVRKMPCAVKEKNLDS